MNFSISIIYIPFPYPNFLIRDHQAYEKYPLHCYKVSEEWFTIFEITRFYCCEILKMCKNEKHYFRD
jgi:hypothetical protein